MKFVTFFHKDQLKTGVVVNDHFIVEVQQAERQKMGDVTIRGGLQDWVENGEHYLNRISEVVQWAQEQKQGQFLHELKDVQLAAPLPRPRKNIFCIGKNYADHAKELGSEADIPEYPMVFSKPPTTVTGPEMPVFLHKEVTDALDYEGELAVVIGKRGKGISKDQAYDYVFGYTLINDVTARDLQQRHKQFLLGKSLDSACPMGPYLVHKNEVADPHSLNIETKVNGEVRQSANTEQMIFDIPTLISTISAGTTIEPGDIIATGTPAGVGKGMKPPQYLRAGDVMEVTVEGLGTLKNTISGE
ncbi:MAG TPA: fumarylacetoacetate hydrolase family protein [Bacillales bacterium]|nr:fumarylacetoacetate hydrolase family protein [Bacillales bacterium]